MDPGSYVGRVKCYSYCLSTARSFFFLSRQVKRDCGLGGDRPRPIRVHPGPFLGESSV